MKNLSEVYENIQRLKINKENLPVVTNLKEAEMKGLIEKRYNQDKTRIAYFAVKKIIFRKRGDLLEYEKDEIFEETNRITEYGIKKKEQDSIKYLLKSLKQMYYEKRR